MSNIGDLSAKLLAFWGGQTSGNVLTAAGVDRKPTFEPGPLVPNITDFNAFGTDSFIVFSNGGLIINFGTVTPVAGIFTWTYPRVFTTNVFTVVACTAFTPLTNFLDRTVIIDSATIGLTSVSGRVTADNSASGAPINLVAFGS